MEDYEKLGVFYLGKEYDLQAKQVREDLLLYDSRDLVTHGVCVGMTGSGKTGLCIGLIEEAALDGIPALIIDPKGDLTNLLLTFPELKPEDFRPWVSEEEAAKKGLTPDDFARQQSELWAKGLADWGEDGDRIRRLREAADFAVYTPGSGAGLPLSIVASFAAPSAALRDDPELLADRVATTATSLLALLGVAADPIQSREHILLSTLLNLAWRQGQDLNLAALIAQIQSPPVTKVGVLDVESFYPAKERFELAMRLNNLLAAPGFAAWMEGEPLDVARLLHTPEGRPRVSILSIAHLADTERMFFVSLLLNEVVGWMRAQPGTGSLRALVYMDEIFGFFPPVAEPPSKRPLLTLLKQARAVGLGVVLATQNPVDLDYKGLANAGTWFIGRLQTERDKERVLEGLEGAAAGSLAGFDRQAMSETLAGLGNRVFLMYDAHEDAPVVFHTRWALSYLRGPLTRTQIKSLMDPRRSAPPTPAVSVSATPTEPPAEPATGPAAAPEPAPVVAARPVLPPEVPQTFVPVRGPRPPAGGMVYRPFLLGAAQVAFRDAKLGVDLVEDVTALAAVTSGAVTVAWEQASVVDLSPADLEDAPAEQATFAELPSSAVKKAAYEGWKRDFATWLYRTRAVEVLRSPVLKQVSRPGETEGEFRVRLQQAAREERDRRVEELRARYGTKLASLDERIRRAQQTVDREQEQARGAHVQTALSVGTTILGAFLGRKTVSAATLGRATTAARGVGRSIDQSGDVGRAEETVAALTQQKATLEADFQADIGGLEALVDPGAMELETAVVRPKKADVGTRLLALAWTPYWRDEHGEESPAWV